MTGRSVLVAGLVLIGGLGAAAAEDVQEHAHDHGMAAAAPAASSEQTLTGEVVDVFCYLSHPAQGIGKEHAGCAKQCIKGGLPVAIKVGDRLYLATMADHGAANAQLAELAAQRVTVTGTVLERDGQHLIAISKIEKAE